MSDETRIDYLVIGQGLAGTCLSHFLIHQGKKILVIDEASSNASSRVAAGLFHVITGRRIVLSWMSATLLPFAEIFYHEMESLLGKRFFYQPGALEVISNAKQWNDWSSRLEDPDINKFAGGNVTADLYGNKLKNVIHYIPVKSSGWVDIPVFLDSFRSRLMEQGLLMNEKFNQDDLKITKSEIGYRDIRAGGIIFCEGVEATRNPLWDWIPFHPAKGEILTIDAPDLPEDYILLKGMFIIPLGNKKFRVGSTYSWDPLDTIPTDAGKRQLQDQLDDFLNIPYSILDHRAGIRPTVADRRPLIGSHPDHENVFIFNGLGTKGVILAPYFADYFSSMLIGEKNNRPETNIKRYYPTTGH